MTYAFQAVPAFDRFMSANPNNRTLAMTLTLFVGPGRLPDWLGTAIGACFVCAGGLAAFVWKPSGSRALALGVTISLLASPVLQLHYLVLAYLPISQAFADGGSRARLWVALLYAVVAISSYVLPEPDDAPLLMGLKGGLPAWGLLGLFAVQCWELRLISTEEKLRSSWNRLRS
jgi:hypothetical protein